MILIEDFMFLMENFMFLIENLFFLIENFMFMISNFMFFIANFKFLITNLVQAMQNTTRWRFLHQLYFCATPLCQCKLMQICINFYEPSMPSNLEKVQKKPELVKQAILLRAYWFKKILWQL